MVKLCHAISENTVMSSKLWTNIPDLKRTWWNQLETWQFLKAKYDYQALEDNLKAIFKNTTLESDKIRTGLCIVAERAPYGH